jgi:hypothetical protein
VCDRQKVPTADRQLLGGYNGRCGYNRLDAPGVLRRGGRQQEYSVPPPFIRRDLIAQCARRPSHHFLDYLDKMLPFFTPIHEWRWLAMLRHMLACIWASVRPKPTATPGRWLRRSAVDDELAAYNEIRQPISERIVLDERNVGMLLGVNLETDEDREMWPNRLDSPLPLSGPSYVPEERPAIHDPYQVGAVRGRIVIKAKRVVRHILEGLPLNLRGQRFLGT